MKRSDIVNFISAKNCCYSSKGIDLFNKVRGGSSTSSCCITKHNLAHSAMDLMQCANVQDIWYKQVIELTVDNTAGDSGNATWGYAKLANLSSTVFFNAGNGNNTNLGTIAGSVSDHNTAIILAQHLNQANQTFFYYGITPSNGSTEFEFYAEAVDTARIRITVWGNENVFVEDTTTYNVFQFFSLTNLTISEDTSKRSKVITTERKYSCLTSAQICDLADYVNRYCDSCTSPTPAAVTT